MADLVDDRLAAAGHALIVDVHSFPSAALPYELHGEQARPEVCIGTDALHTPALLAEAAAVAFAGGDVGNDEPFAGTYVPTRHYRTDDRVRSVMIEIRRDTYLDERSGEAHDGFPDVVEGVTKFLTTAPDLLLIEQVID